MWKQISSAVPEGKGVSSSAALEVATMTAIAAAHGKLSQRLLDWVTIEK
jgi:galactokinase